MHPRDLPEVFARLERHEHLPSEPWLNLLPPPSPQQAAVVAFPAYVIVAADVDRRWLDSWLSGADFAAPSGPPFLNALEDRLRLEAGALDVVLLAARLPGDPPLDLTPLAASDHPRVARAHRYRSDVRIWTTPHGVLIVGRGLAGRWEAAVEVHEPSRNQGHGRALAAAARHLVPEDRPLWAQVAPGNASSLRAFLAAGYVPVGSEVLLSPSGHELPPPHNREPSDPEWPHRNHLAAQ
jgi:GNAT superfamily N-acetyltransferase